MSLLQEDEPIPGQHVPPTTSSLVLDSAQVPSISPSAKQTQFLQTGGFVYRNKEQIVGSPVDFTTELPLPFAKSTGTGTNVVRAGGAFVSGPASFESTINPLSGCSRMRYYGSFTSGADWDTHRANTLLSIRVFIAPDDPLLAGDGDFFIKDFYIKVPDGLVFRDDIRASRRDVANMLNFLIQNKTMRSDYPRPSEGWRPMEEAAFSEPATSLFSVYLDEPSQRIIIQMNKNNLKAGYKNGISSFVVFDNPNSLTTSGGLWSGFGYGNEQFDYARSAQQSQGSFDPLLSVFRKLQYKSYPGGYNLRATIPSLGYFSDVDTGAMNKTQYFEVRSATYTGFGYPSDIGENDPNSTFLTVYQAVRPAALTDSRYLIHNSRELCTDKKIIPNHLIGVPTAIGADTFGITFQSFENHEIGATRRYNTKEWRELESQGSDRWHPGIHLEKNTSSMRVDVQTFNEYGELLAGSSEGQAPGRRDFLAVDWVGAGTFHPLLPPAGQDEPPFIAYCKMLYPTAAIETVDSMSVNFPGWSYYKATPPLPSPASLSDIENTFLTRPADLSDYIDNTARIGTNDSITHFLLAEMY